MIALVAGAAGGIGHAVVAQLESRGWQVKACDLQGPVVLDVRDPRAWEEAVGARLDLLVNAAGYLEPGRLESLQPADIERHFEVNLRGVVLGTQAAARAMGPGGHIVNLGSLAGLTPVPGLSLYSASKYAVRAFSIAAAAELRPRGIAVTVVCPDAVQTPMLDLQKDRPEAALTFSGSRTLTPDEVARAIAGPVLRRRPLEYWMPPSRGWLCRLSDLFPELALRAMPYLQRRGRSRQAE